MTEPQPAADTESQKDLRAGQTRPRLWPWFLIFLLAAVRLSWVWLVKDVSRQDKNIETVIVLFVCFLLLLLWVLLFSQIRWRLRFSIIGSIALAALTMVALFRIRGVSGDLLPILEWRWRLNRNASQHELPQTRPAGHEQPSASYPQFLGPDRNGVLAGPKLARNWTTNPPTELWRHAVGAAWSGFSIQENFAVTQEQWGEKEVVVCYDLFSGKRLWSHEDDAHYLTTIAGEGPRATPTIVSNRVYALGATGLLNCLELQSGKVVWSKDIVWENQSRMNEWGISSSPLVVDHLLIVSAGGAKGRSLVAYHKDNGQFVWGAGNDGAGYSSPVLGTLGGVRQILIFNASGVASHDAASGQILWKYPWPRGHPHVTAPLFLPQDRVLIASGYGTGSELVEITKNGDAFAVSRIWKSIRMKPKFANLIIYDRNIYGLDDGTLACVSLDDGTLRWKEGRYGHGQTLLVGSLILLMAEKGEVVLIDPSPDGLRELTKFEALKGKTWNPPALAGNYLLVRNDQEAACFRLPAEL